MLIIFDIPDENVGLSDTQIEGLVHQMSLFTICTEWRWVRDVHLDNIEVKSPKPPTKRRPTKKGGVNGSPDG